MAILNNVEHGDLRYVPLFGAEYGDATNRMQVYPDEFSDAQRDHPIVFGPDADGQLVAMVLLGLEKAENVHWNGTDWGAAYMPAVRRRGPFSVSVKTDATGQEIDMLVDVDLTDKRVGKDRGEALFKPQGGNSAVLDAISEALLTVYAGAKAEGGFLSALLDLDLLQEVQIEVDLGNGRHYSIPEHLVIDSDRFAELSGDDLKALNDAGFLVPVVHAMTSVANIQKLIDQKVAADSRAA